MRWLQILVPLLLPTLAYLIWVKVQRSQARASGATNFLPLYKGPWFILVAAGLVLMIGSLALLAGLGGGIPAGEYVPPVLEDNRVVPAHRTPPDE